MEDSKEWKEPEENPATFEKVKAMLNEAKVKYEVSEHQPVLTSEEAAKVRGVSLESGAKAMLLKDTGKKLAMEGVPYYMAIISASCRFSSKQFKKLIKCKSLRFASPQEVWESTGTVTGAVPPFGRIFNMPLWVDRSMGRNEMINFNCGLRTKSISMRYDDWFKVENPTWHVFTDEEIEKGDLPAEAKEEEKKGGANERGAKKQDRLRKRQEQAEEAAKKKAEEYKNDPSSHLYGERPLNRSQGDPELRFQKKLNSIEELNATYDGKEVLVRARLHQSRDKGVICHIELRQQYYTVQAVLKAGNDSGVNVSKLMVNFAGSVPKESIVEIKAKAVVPNEPVTGCTQKEIELQV